MKPETRSSYEAAVVRAVKRIGRSLDEARTTATEDLVTDIEAWLAEAP